MSYWTDITDDVAKAIRAPTTLIEVLRVMYTDIGLPAYTARGLLNNCQVHINGIVAHDENQLIQDGDVVSIRWPNWPIIRATLKGKT